MDMMWVGWRERSRAGYPSTIAYVLLFQDKDLIVPANGVADVEVRQTC
jgi:hypothetical protein